MEIHEAVKLRILNLIKEKNITINKLATLSGMAQSTVNDIITGQSKNPKLLTIVRLCYGFDMQLDEFFNDPVFKDIEDD